MNSSNNADARPKSAGGLFGSGSAAARQQSGGSSQHNRYGNSNMMNSGSAQQNAAPAAASSALSYGALKNRFMPGSSGGAQGSSNAAAPMVSGNSGANAKSKSSSKLFSLAR